MRHCAVVRYAGHLPAAGRSVAAGGSGAAGVLRANPVIPLFQTVRLRSRAALESVRKHFGLPTLPFAGPPPNRRDRMQKPLGFSTLLSLQAAAQAASWGGADFCLVSDEKKHAIFLFELEIYYLCICKIVTNDVENNP